MSAPEGTVQALAEMLLRACPHRVSAPSRPRQQHVTHPPSIPLRSVRFFLVFNNCFHFPFLRDQGEQRLWQPLRTWPRPPKQTLQSGGP